MKVKTIIKIYVIAILMCGCQIQPDVPVVLPDAEVVNSIEGTWVQSISEPTRTTTNNLVIATDGSFKETTIVIISNKTDPTKPSYNYSAEKGVITFINNQFTKKSNSYTKSVTPIDDSSIWKDYPIPEIQSMTTVIADKKMYQREVYKAEGICNNLVGSWIRIVKSGEENQLSGNKFVLEITESLWTQKTYYLNSGANEFTLLQNIPMTYVVDTAKSYLTFQNGTSNYYKFIDSCILFDSINNIDTYAYIKQ